MIYRYKSMLFIVLIIAFLYGCGGLQRNKVAKAYEATGITLEASRQGVWAAYDSGAINKEKRDSLLVEYEKARKLFIESGLSLKASALTAKQGDIILSGIKTTIKEGQ